MPSVRSLYHVWFSTKGRKRALEGEIRDDVLGLLSDIATRTGIQIVEMEAISDHAHLLLSLERGQTLASVMHQLKGASARRIFLAYPELKLDMGSNSFWQKGYGSRRVRPNEVAALRKYIRTQADRPLRRG